MEVEGVVVKLDGDVGEGDGTAAEEKLMRKEMRKTGMKSECMSFARRYVAVYAPCRDIVEDGLYKLWKYIEAEISPWAFLINIQLETDMSCLRKLGISTRQSQVQQLARGLRQFHDIAISHALSSHAILECVAEQLHGLSTCKSFAEMTHQFGSILCGLSGASWRRRSDD